MTSTVAMHAGLGSLLLILGAVLVLGPKRKGTHTISGHVYHWLLLGTCASGLIIGLSTPEVSAFEIVTPPTYLLGLLGYLAAKWRKPWFGKPWLFWHIIGQGGSYIGVWTAFAFQIVPASLLPWPHRLWMLMALPSAVGGPLIARAVGRWVGGQPSPHGTGSRRGVRRFKTDKPSPPGG